MTGRRLIGIALILFAIGFNAPYAWLAANFSYPDVLRRPPSEILLAVHSGGEALILAWAGFALAALLMAPAAIGLAVITRNPNSDAQPNGVAALGIAAAVTQAIGLSRWVYAVPLLASAWMAYPGDRHVIEVQFLTLHQFAGVGIGEAIGQSLTAFWMIGAGFTQFRHPHFGMISAALAWISGALILVGVSEGLATVIEFDPGVLAYGATAGYLVLTLWLVWTGVRAITAKDKPRLGL